MLSAVTPRRFSLSEPTTRACFWVKAACPSGHLRSLEVFPEKSLGKVMIKVLVTIMSIWEKVSRCAEVVGNGLQVRKLKSGSLPMLFYGINESSYRIYHLSVYKRGFSYPNCQHHSKSLLK